MAESTEKADKKTAKNFRLSSKTIGTLVNLASHFQESQAVVIERAISFLDANRDLAAKQEYNRRTGQAG